MFQVIIIVILTPFLLVILYALSARLSWHATLVPENECAYLMAGNKVLKYLPNIPEHFVDSSGKKRPLKIKRGEDASGNPIIENDSEYEPPGELTKYLQSNFGIYHGSFLWPFVRIHKFEIEPDRLVNQDIVGKDAPITSRIKHSKKPRTVRSLRVQFPRPFLFLEMELGEDRFPVDFLVHGIFTVVNFRQSVIVLRGRMFNVLASEISGRLNDYLRDKAYTVEQDESGKKRVKLGLVEMARGPGSDFSRFMQGLNDILAKSVGVIIDDLWIEEMNPSDDKLQEATEAARVAALKGEAEVIASKKRLTVAKNDAKGRAVIISNAVKAWGDPVLANRQAVSENLSRVQVLNFGGSGAGTMIDLGPITPKPEPAPKKQ